MMSVVGTRFVSMGAREDNDDGEGVPMVAARRELAPDIYSWDNGDEYVIIANALAVNCDVAS
jgi:hypothetical protein